jgi:phthalate 4,5-dioxygenase oxygenase subunit
MAIVAFRRQMLDAVKSFANGGPAIGVGELQIPAEVCSFQGVIPKTTDWRVYEAQALGVVFPDLVN